MAWFQAPERQPGSSQGASVELHSIWVESGCSGEATEEEVKTQHVLTQVQGVLDNLDDLMKQLSALEINTEPRLRNTIELIFDRAALVQNEAELPKVSLTATTTKNLRRT